ncbi:hypothetical protein F5Y13DRAFT_151288 [Hypoxylon sp. FL1857]|nr:hypothetical protein F5Y13DRAFT_151288 [Hypoxylon sp. FL1857]
MILTQKLFLRALLYFCMGRAQPADAVEVLQYIMVLHMMSSHADFVISRSSLCFTKVRSTRQLIGLTREDCGMAADGRRAVSHSIAYQDKLIRRSSRPWQLDNLGVVVQERGASTSRPGILTH